MGKGSPVGRNRLRDLWRLLGSTRLAAVLLAALLLASLLAAMLPQMPADPAAREPWLAAVRLRYRGATGLFLALGLFDAYHAPWFLALLAAVLLNSVLCTAQRLPRLWKSFTQPPVVSRPDAFYQGFAHRAEWPGSTPQAALSAAQRALARHRYRTYLERDEAAGQASVYAERGRWAGAGTLVSHLAVVLLVTLLLARPALGWQQTGVMLLPDQARALDRDPSVVVRAGQLAIERHPDGQPRSYQVPLAILVDAQPVVTQTVGINHPLTFRGMSFHLESYGPAARLVTPEGTMNLVFTDSQAQEATLLATGITLRVAFQPETRTFFVEAMSADGALLGSGIVPAGDEITVQETPVTFTLGNYTTWQISRDPTFGLAVGAAVFVLAGMLVSLWVPHRRIWLRVDSQQMRMVGAGELGGEFEALTSEITSAIASEHAASQPEGEADGQ